MNQYMSAAIEEAQNGVQSGEGGPFGAVVVHQGKIVGRGHNTVIKTNDPTAHAEINAIRQASQALGRFDLSDCTIYTTCEPCPMCYSAVYWARIPIVYRGATQEDAAAIGFDDQAIYDDLAQPPDKRKIPMEEVDREACLEPFRLWEEKPDKALY
jgi:guanine deaminase